MMIESDYIKPLNEHIDPIPIGKHIVAKKTCRAELYIGLLSSIDSLHKSQVCRKCKQEDTAVACLSDYDFFLLIDEISGYQCFVRLFYTKPETNVIRSSCPKEGRIGSQTSTN